ncbi:MAG TPA: hypothetical protein VK842_08350 [bacterium]|nr:hypothetical protein [bacterium]
MLKAKVLLAALVLGPPTLGLAGVPEGSGALGLGVGFSPAQVVDSGELLNAPPDNINYSSQGAWQQLLQADLPVWSGLSLDLRAGFAEERYTTDFNTTVFGNTAVDENQQVFHGAGELRAYPAAFAGKPFHPGANANPDGWLLWPSVGLRYGVDSTSDFGGYRQSGSPGTYAYEENVYTTDQGFRYRLVLPLAGWASVSGGYQRNSGEDVTTSDLARTSLTPGESESEQSGGVNEGEFADLNLYLDLAPGAGGDPGRAFVPGLGRQGQLMVDLGWSRSIVSAGRSWTGSQSYTLTVGAPLASSLGLTFAVSQSEYDVPTGGAWATLAAESDLGNQTENRDTMTYQCAAVWALGSPAGRVDP